MPTYTYQCAARQCGKIFQAIRHMAERATAPCECGATAKKDYAGSLSATVHLFPEGVFEHIAFDPVYVNDKRHLRDLSREHDFYAPGLLDGGPRGEI